MKLPIPSFGKKEKPEYFLTLLLRDDKVNATILEELAGRVHVLSENEAYFQDSIETASIDEFLSVLDSAISTAESSLSEKIETQKTIFGVKENWVEGTKIKKDYLVKLKKASDALGLSPIGFLVLHEAISHLLHEEEGAPVSAILTEVGKKEIAVSIIRGGKILETQRTKIVESIPKTVDTLLHHFTSADILPSRIIIFDGDKPTIYASDLEHLAQEFTSFSWSKNLPFLHMPKIVILPKGFDAKAVLHGAATQMGFEVLGSLPKPEEVTPTKISSSETVSHEMSEKENQVPLPQKSPVTEENFVETFGFVQGQDIAQQSNKPITAIETPDDTVSTSEEQQLTNEEEIDTKSISEKKVMHTTVLTKIITGGNIFLHKITSVGNTLIKNNIFSSVHLPVKKRDNQYIQQQPSQQQTKNKTMVSIKKFLIFLIVILFALCGGYIFYLMNLKATITLTMNPTLIEKEEDITFTTDGTASSSANTVSGSAFSVDENGTLSTPATGTKETGNKSKGKITIYNSDLTAGKTIPSGTAITAPNGLVFTLDSTVNLASASGDASSITSSSTTTAITASAIGKEYNLPSGTKFSVGSNDAASVIAKNDSAFEGGSKDEITIVAKADIDKLLSTLPTNLQDKATNDLSQKATGDKSVLPIITDTTISKKSFDKNIGDEAKQVTLTATITYTTLSYKKEDVAQVAQTLLQSQMGDMILSSKGIETTIDSISIKKDNSTVGKLHAKASLIPRLDKEKIFKSISSKPLADALEELHKLPQVNDVKITFSPSLPFLPKLLPQNSSNTAIIIQNND